MAVEITLPTTGKSYRSKSYVRTQVVNHWPDDVRYMIVKNDEGRYKVVVINSGSLTPGFFAHNGHMVVG